MNSTTLVLGGNGAGKSTLLRLVAGIMPSTTGSIERNSSFNPISRAFLGSQLGLYSWLSARETLDLQLSLLPQREQATQKLLGDWNLIQFADTPIRSLSQGQRARVALARVLANSPKYIFLDEPTANLDDGSVSILFQNLETMENKSLVVIATHDIERCLPYASRLLLLQEGRVASDSGTDTNSFHGVITHYQELNR
jgi:ABC-type multidrug transport system ATPase subunit